MLKNNYKLIPMSEITDDAREIAKRWYDGVSEMNDIHEKHKLASDIMNYSNHRAEPIVSSLKEICEHYIRLIEGVFELNGMSLEERRADLTVYNKAIKVLSDFSHPISVDNKK